MRSPSYLLALSIILFSLSCNKAKEPIACIEVDKSTAAAGESITFTSCSENEFSYIWTISGPDSATENSLQWNDRVFTREMSVPGSYKVKLTVFNDFSFLGDSQSDSTSVTIN